MGLGFRRMAERRAETSSVGGSDPDIETKAPVLASLISPKGEILGSGHVSLASHCHLCGPVFEVFRQSFLAACSPSWGFSLSAPYLVEIGNYSKAKGSRPSTLWERGKARP